MSDEKTDGGRDYICTTTGKLIPASKMIADERELLLKWEKEYGVPAQVCAAELFGTGICLAKATGVDSFTLAEHSMQIDGFSDACSLEMLAAVIATDPDTSTPTGGV